MTTTVRDDSLIDEARKESPFFADVWKWLLAAIALMGLSPEAAERVKGNFRHYPFVLKLVRDNGEEDYFNGFLVIWWPGLVKRKGRASKGGTRWELTLASNLFAAMALALLMMLKCALLRLPFDGAKCAIEVDGASLSSVERQRLFQAFALKLIELQVAGPDGYVSASDKGTFSIDMDAMREAFESEFGPLSYACVTGKSAERGGILGREESTGYFAALITHWEADRLDTPLDQRTAVVQGFGKVGYWVASHLRRLGWKVVGISDVTGAIYNPNGLDPERILGYIKVGPDKSLATFAEDSHTASAIDSIEMLKLSVTAVVLAATELALPEEVAEVMQARIVADPANDGVDFEAGQTLRRRGIRHRGLIFTTGGVAVSYLEWLLGRGQYPGASIEAPPTREDVLARAEDIIRDAYQRVCSLEDSEQPPSGEFSIVAAAEQILADKAELATV